MEEFVSGIDVPGGLEQLLPWVELPSVQEPRLASLSTNCPACVEYDILESGLLVLSLSEQFFPLLNPELSWQPLLALPQAELDMCDEEQ